MLKTIKRIKSIYRDVSFLRARNSRFCSYIGDGQILTELWDGTKIYAVGRDRSVAPHLMFNGEWEMDITKIYLDHLPRTGNVLDCGANHGYFGLLALSQSEADLHFFEINKLLAELIRDSVDINGWSKRSSVVREAVSSKSGLELEVREPKGYLGSASLEALDYNLSGEKLEISRSYKVKTISLDDYCLEQGIETIDLMKLDVESHEEQVILGAERMLKSGSIRKLLMEYTPGAYSAAFADLIDGYFSNISIVENGKLRQISSVKDIQSIDFVTLLLIAG